MAEVGSAAQMATPSTPTPVNDVAPPVDGDRVPADPVDKAAEECSANEQPTTTDNAVCDGAKVPDLAPTSNEGKEVNEVDAAIQKIADETNAALENLQGSVDKNLAEMDVLSKTIIDGMAERKAVMTKRVKKLEKLLAMTTSPEKQPASHKDGQQRATNANAPDV